MSPRPSKMPTPVGECCALTLFVAANTNAKMPVSAANQTFFCLRPVKTSISQNEGGTLGWLRRIVNSVYFWSLVDLPGPVPFLSSPLFPFSFLACYLRRRIFFLNNPATTDIYLLPLPGALPI